MALVHSPSIVRDSSLVLYYDAANIKSQTYTVSALVVAGGGGGSVGGGGAGGLLYTSSLDLIPETAYTVTVGTGGAASTVWGGNAANGTNSIFSTLTAIGGGAGNHNTIGSLGGSGGGGGYSAAGGSGTAGQGFAGGSGLGTPNYPGGGGGGAGSIGANAVSTSIAGAGGKGLELNIIGTSVYYSGGGGGGTQAVGGTGGTGGLGGGGAGGGTITGTAGTANTGGGGGGGYAYGGMGGSGIVIIRYEGNQKATGGTITSSEGDTIHTFTSSGTFTFNNSISDLSGNNNIGTLINGPTFDSNNGGSIVFDGTNDYISVPYNSSINPSNTLTIEFWFKKTAIAVERLLCSTARTTSGWTVDIYQSKLIFQVFPSTSFTSSTQTLSSGVIYCATITYNSGSINYYINGVSVGTASHTFANNTTTPLIIGGYTFNWPTINYPWDGNIYSVKIYNRALTEAEVEQNFNAMRGRYGI